MNKADDQRLPEEQIENTALAAFTPIVAAFRRCGRNSRTIVTEIIPAKRAIHFLVSC